MVTCSSSNNSETNWMKRTPCLSHIQESKCQTVTHRKLTGNNRVIHKVALSFTPYALFQWYPESQEI